MNTRCHWLLGLIILLMATPKASAADELTAEPTWHPVRWQEARSTVLAWAKQAGTAEQTIQEIMVHWPTAPPSEADDRLNRLAQTFALTHHDLAAFYETCTEPPANGKQPDFEWLFQQIDTPLVVHHLRLYYARWLAQHQLYDEALQTLDGLQPTDVLSPETLLFLRAIAHHQLVELEASVQNAKRLLEHSEQLSQRHRTVAKLLLGDLDGVEPNSLNYIARLMDDIRRRLELGRAGLKVRQEEDEVIKALDKMIEQLEKQRQQQMSMAPSGSGGGGGQPAPDSFNLPGKGPGQVTKKDIGTKSGWGTLPPKEREAALQQIGKQFPSHLGDAIQQYFRKIANDDEKASR